MTNLLKWQQKHLDWIATLSNQELLDEVITTASGDDYDGCFTARGLWEHEALQNELYKRLDAIGFIKLEDI